MGRNGKDLAWNSLFALALFLLSAARHLSFRSGAFDLGIFDQAVWLMSRGEEPVVSMLGIHILGDHGAWILYLLAPLYLIWSSPLMLLLVQALSYGVGGFLVTLLARDAALKEDAVRGVWTAYLLHPLLFNTAMFDFHPDAFIVPLMLLMVWAARRGHSGVFAVAVLLGCGCKESLGLSVAGVGVWMALCTPQRFYGVVAAMVGSLHCYAAIAHIIPHYSPAGPSGTYRFAEFGATPGAILSTMLSHPLTTLGRLHISDGFKFLFSIAAPFLLCYRLRSATLLVAAIPALAINLLSDSDTQRSIIFQYGLPLLPIAVVAAIEGLSRAGAVPRARWLALPAAIVFLFFVGRGMAKKRGDYPHGLMPFRGTFSALRHVVPIVPDGASVIAPSELVPHLTHRRLIDIAGRTAVPRRPEWFDVVILNESRPGWLSDPSYVEDVKRTLQNRSDYFEVFGRDGVTVFMRRSGSGAHD